MPMSTDTLTHRAAALVEEIAMATREQWSATRIGELAAIREEVLDELHGRAADENDVRDVTAVLETEEVQGLLLVASEEKAVLLREELARRARVQTPATVVIASGARHGKNYPGCSAGVDQWR